MTRSPALFRVVSFALVAAATAAAFPTPRGDTAGAIKLPPGFSIAPYASGVPNARSMTQGPKGVLFVGTRVNRGKVYAVLDRDGDGRAEKVVTVASGLNMPNGVAWRDGSLYVAEISRVLRFDGLPAWLDGPPGAPAPKPAIVRDDFPRDAHHGWTQGLRRGRSLPQAGRL
jgi:glucose/arabinose dehydrogenase